MSDTFIRTCDRCGKDTNSQMDAVSWPSVSIAAIRPMLSALGVSQSGSILHICQGCLPILAAMFPKAEIGRFAQHEMRIEVRPENRVETDQVAIFNIVRRRAQDGVRVIDKRDPSSVSNMPPVDYFRPMRIEIHDKRVDWTICDVRIGNRSVFLQAGEIPGDLFGSDVDVNDRMAFGIWHPGMDFEIHAKYIGKNPEGARFSCDVIGIAPGFGPDVKIPIID